MDFYNAEKYPYKPDLIMGLKGQKVGVFVLSENEVMRDTNNPTGYANFK